MLEARPNFQPVLSASADLPRNHFHSPFGQGFMDGVAMFSMPAPCSSTWKLRQDSAASRGRRLLGGCHVVVVQHAPVVASYRLAALFEREEVALVLACV